MTTTTDRTDRDDTRAARAEVMAHLTSKWTVPVISVLAELGVADLVADGPLPVDELAAAVGADSASLYRVLRASASIGLFVEEADGRFASTAMSDCLRSDATNSLRPVASMFGLAPFWDPYSRIRHSITTGEPAFDLVFGTSVYAYLQAHPELATVFGAAAASFHAEAIEAISAAHDFSGYSTVVDVGGGNGSLLARILLDNPGVRGVLHDVETVLPTARDLLTEAGVADRVELVGGDFFAFVPTGDALLIKSCLHNFSDDQAIEILKVMRAAVPDDGRLLVAETVVPAGSKPHYAKWDDVEMLVLAGGVDRSEQQWLALLEAGGFRSVAVTGCGERFSLIEAVPG